MDCLELPIPPMPQLLTVNRVVYHKPTNHFSRIFPLYDIILVAKGAFYITEEDVEYNIQENSLLVLEPYKQHWGHQKCLPGTILYYLHFKHPSPLQTVYGEEIQWNSVYPTPNYWDHEPCKQSLYIPKFATIDTAHLIPLLDQMVLLRQRFTLENLLLLQSLLGQVLVLLQKAARSQSYTRSQEISQLIVNYLHANIEKPFRLEELSKQLNFHLDYLTKCLKKHTGMTAIQYLNRLRIEKAKLLLEQTDLVLQQVGEKVGIGDYNYFFRLFRKHSGVTPAQYRMSYKYRSL
jgi:AraC-like DNA-binding protein